MAGDHTPGQKCDHDIIHILAGKQHMRPVAKASLSSRWQITGMGGDHDVAAGQKAIEDESALRVRRSGLPRTPAAAYRPAQTHRGTTQRLLRYAVQNRTADA